MKAIVYRGPKNMVIEERPMPEITAQDVLIKIKYVSICGGDLHIYRAGIGSHWEGQIMGHEFIGYAEKVGSAVQGLQPGDRVWGMNAMPCGECVQCKAGNAWGCYNLLDRVTGQGLPGGMAQYIVHTNAILGATIFKIPDSIPDKHAALIEPFSVGCSAVKQTQLSGADNVVIFGAGMIGNAVLQFAKLAGVKSVTVSDVAEGRLDIARACGADYIINPAKEQVLPRIQELFGPNRWFHGESGAVDVAFECAGVTATLKSAIEILRAGGKLSLVALSEGDVSFELSPVVFKRPQFIIPTCGGEILETIEAMAAGQLIVEPLLTGIFPLEKATEAFETQANSKNSMKVLIEMNP